MQFKDVYRKFKHAANLLIDTTGAPSEALSSGQATSQSGGTAGGGGAAARPDLSTVNSRGIRSSSLVLRPTEDTHLNRFLSKTRSALRRKGKILHRMLVGRWGGFWPRTFTWRTTTMGQHLHGIEYNILLNPFYVFMIREVDGLIGVFTADST